MKFLDFAGNGRDGVIGWWGARGDTDWRVGECHGREALTGVIRGWHFCAMPINQPFGFLNAGRSLDCSAERRRPRFKWSPTRPDYLFGIRCQPAVASRLRHRKIRLAFVIDRTPELPTHCGKKVLLNLVREALQHPATELTDIAPDPRAVSVLRTEGFLHQDRDELTNEAVLAYFVSFPELQCPVQVLEWVGCLGSSGFRWRRMGEGITCEDSQNLARTYPLQRTIFVRADAPTGTWLRELGHAVFCRIEGGAVADLVKKAKQLYSVVSASGCPGAIDGATG